ncbi:histone-lysine N-methyltransferase, H3 lysine-79 specific isoform X2 [Adelges cooleyi]|uniref:histone-lysine N-methyltransferase, H3 lysine-79 specific isoform X2 n=1 Tax=Adelges cooleyi TaxID=133065 RepID=UPI0021801181|nr:histone-lysine N-methyltransferase, H3 lysine-79 specific isoform X2 [Adelges cooleyi]
MGKGKRSPERQFSANERRFDLNYDNQIDRNLSFPPISHDCQTQNIQNNSTLHPIHKIDKEQLNENHIKGIMDDFKPKTTHTILNRTYTIAKENGLNDGPQERQKWDRQYILNHNTEFNMQNLTEHERRYMINENNRFGTPAWVEHSSDRVLSGQKIQTEDVRKTSDFKGSCDTLSSLDSTNINNRTYLLGQNVPLTTEELANREIKRHKALELQEAIKQQLKERQMKKREEIERKKQEDLAEERRIKRQQEIEKKRLEDEIKRQKEKELCDERKAKAMQEVLENAQKQAKEDKSKHMQKKRQAVDEVKQQIPETVVTPVITTVEKNSVPQADPEPQPICLSEETIPKETVPKLPEVDLQTSPAKLNRQKLLTPSKYRSQTASIATQTDESKRPKATRTVYQKSIELEKRPKWGVNRPEVQYVKQSAKDPNYQMKLKQKSTWNGRTGSVSSGKSQSDTPSTAQTNFMVLENGGKHSSKNMSAYSRPNFAEMNNYKSVSIPSTSESIAVSDVLYQLSSLRKVLETKRKHWKSVITDESPSSDSS